MHGSSVAELVLTLILASKSRLPYFLDAQREGRWDLVEADDLRDKRVLIIGAGDLGEQTARRLRGFEAAPAMVAHLEREGVHATVELPDLLPDADVVVLTLPLTAQTQGSGRRRILGPDAGQRPADQRGPGQGRRHRALGPR